MARCRKFTPFTPYSLSSTLQDKDYGFTGNEIEPESVEEIRSRCLDYLKNICKVSRIEESQIETVKVTITPDAEDNTHMEIYIEACDPILQLFYELGIK